MFTLVLLYILNYSIILLLVFFYLVIQKFNKNCAQSNFVEFLTASCAYSKGTWALKFLILQLSGVPPFIFFYIKFNFFNTSIQYVDFILLILMLINALLGMFFYLKVFSLNTDKYSDESLKNFLRTRNDLTDTSRDKYIYWFWMCFAWFSFLNFLAPVYFIKYHLYASFYL